METLAYDTLAPAYGCLTAGYDVDRWVGELVDLTHRHGRRGRAALDVACGTGSTMLPLLDRGFDVTGVDRSEGMLAIADRRLDGAAATVCEDMCELSRLGAFDLVTCLGDALNHLLDLESVERALHGMAANLAAGGLVVFDLNTLSTLRSAFSASSVATDEDAVVVWRGLGDPELPPLGRTAAELTVVDLRDRERPPETVIVEERHHPLELVLERVRGAGLAPLDVRGSLRGGRLDGEAPDDRVHHKLVIVARKEVIG